MYVYLLLREDGSIGRCFMTSIEAVEYRATKGMRHLKIVLAKVTIEE